MSRFISIIIGIIITLSSSLIFTASAVAAIGLDNGHLAACPSSPNCVVSQDGDEKHAVEPITYKSDRATAKETLLKVLSVVPRTEVIEDTDNYIYAESTSRIFKFVDDAEFYFPEDENIIQVRSASRVGESDLGVNRRRIEQIRLAMQDLGV
ncbi:DUF1499 domain-containing protein [Pleurocapsa sp. FMAR1]|uniref:DUF1499 domain-containing protein n=1 Tax=Pleurocapsa sp. FMAR1 TaxID=3040204 RepID=UPI0029C7960D|nr:DUF1499 domain-containing protein [Pleurocapsa sp. FMAR1]